MVRIITTYACESMYMYLVHVLVRLGGLQWQQVEIAEVNGGADFQAVIARRKIATITTLCSGVHQSDTAGSARVGAS